MKKETLILLIGIGTFGSVLGGTTLCSMIDRAQQHIIADSPQIFRYSDFQKRQSELTPVERKEYESLRTDAQFQGNYQSYENYRNIERFAGILIGIGAVLPFSQLVIKHEK